jgi:hypothetical protein
MDVNNEVLFSGSKKCDLKRAIMPLFDEQVQDFSISRKGDKVMGRR